jgi:hypothetical protein
MPDLVMMVPSRGRPQHAVELAEAFAATCTADTDLWVVVDHDDPEATEYARLLDSYDVMVATSTAYRSGPGMVPALNQAALYVAEQIRPAAVGFMGDDHRPRTVGWDAAFLRSLKARLPALVYGNDLFQRGNLPTQVAMSTEIVEVFRWMAPPVLRHLFADDFWLDLGHGAAAIEYLPGVVIEHMHPAAGKAVMDGGYETVNAPTSHRRDQTAYHRWVDAGGLAACVAAVNQLKGVGSE